MAKNPSSFTEEEIARAQALRDKMLQDEDTPVDESWVFLAEFGMYFGYEGIRAILSNDPYLEGGRAEELLRAARVVHSRNVIDHGQAVRAGVRSALSNKGTDAIETFKTLLSGHFKRSGMSNE